MSHDPSTRRPRRALPPSPSGSGSSHSDSPRSTSVDSANPASTRTDAFTRAARRLEDDNVRSLLSTVPSSPKQLMRRLEQQQQEIRALRDANTTLKSREVEVSSLTVYLQDRINATQNQVDHIKTQVLLQLSNPIVEEEYNRIDSLPEPEQDLVDVIKLGIYRQLNTLRTSQQAATRRAAELSSTVAQLQQENAEMKVRLSEHDMHQDNTKERAERQQRQQGTLQARIAELENTITTLESKNKAAYVDQEQYLSSKLTAQVKTDEVARLAVRLEESEMDTQRYRASAECTEQKLDILKAEYYELKLDYGQRVLKLEAALRASEEKLKTLGDLEIESELFISNMAASSQGEVALRWETPGDAGAYESWMALPRSRKLAHSLTVTKRCLHLENKVSALEHEVGFKETQVARLQLALSGARDALNSINSPYSLVEKALEEVTNENEAIKQKMRVLEQDKSAMQSKLQHYSANMRLLTQHRKELLHIKKMLRQLGMREGFVFPRTDGGADEGEEGEGGDADTKQRTGCRQSSAPMGVVRSPVASHQRSHSVTAAPGGTAPGSRNTPPNEAEASSTPPDNASPFASMRAIEIRS